MRNYVNYSRHLKPLFILCAVLLFSACSKKELADMPAAEQSYQPQQTITDAMMKPDEGVAENQRLAKPAQADVDYLKEVYQGATLEVLLGRMALTHSTTGVVKQFGKRMVNDHSIELKVAIYIASLKGIDLPDTLSAEQQLTIAILLSMYGADFDHAYIAYMVTDHTMDVEKTQYEAQNGTDPVIRNFAKFWLPLLRDHLRHAKWVAHYIGMDV